MSLPKPIRNIALLFAFAALSAALVTARSSYAGTTGLFCAFNASFLFLIALIFPRPRSYVFGCFAVLLTLGFWFKFLVHRIVDYPFVEPIGDFVDCGDAWDRVLLWSAFAALGAAAPRCAHLIVARLRRSEGTVGVTADREPPAWFVERRVVVWTATLVMLVVVALINIHESIYRIGIETHTRLPRPLPLIIAWIVSLGGGMAMATLLHWDRRLTSQSSAAAWSAVILEAIVSSASAISRALYLLRMAPYLFATVGQVRTKLSRRLGAILMLLAGFGVSISLVTAQRMNDYIEATKFSDVEAEKDTIAIAIAIPQATPQLAPQHAPQPVQPRRIVAVDRASYLFGYIRQTVMLTSDRWIGLEGVMAVSAHPDLGPDMLRLAVVDDPRRGYDTLFQQTARSPYLKLAALDRYTFLTLPGITGICAYGGSGWYIFGGLSIVTAMMMGIEVFCHRLTGNPFLTALVALNLTYVVHQMNFPYLTIVYVAELIMTVLAIELTARTPWRAAMRQKVVE